ncbi:MAG: hypothetical protein GF353_24470 [Candidatus Lokiarchaeota archaeon]|nr:hypothetical protein [Candidatus Lokiarchaeota archaeon]
MKLNVNFNRLIQEDLKNELQWFKDEFDLLFAKSNNLSESEMNNACLILDQLTESINIAQLFPQLSSLLRSLEKKFPVIFNSE